MRSSQTKRRQGFSEFNSNMIIIQHITTLWTKKSRGMPAAEKRNAVPHRLLLPEAPRPPPPVFVHEVIAQEGNNFQLQQTTEFPASEEQYWSFQFQQQADQLEVLFTYSWTEHGAPDRGSYTRPLFSLKLSQTGAFAINGRFSSDGGQSYAAHSVNLGFVNRFHNNLFLTQAPAHSIDLRAQLF
ncbi:hypothetical protein V6x_17570 [Gimesia chilikensis]|uniref:Uncharacterized protein n=1 Tax=Gimesia chilikensis TaxID=2605989 RepID=A0A517W9Y6_9PLAN|nr:hypothetical protein V6x_17570 [Gimesia chilikensis]